MSENEIKTNTEEKKSNKKDPYVVATRFISTNTKDDGNSI